MPFVTGDDPGSAVVCYQLQIPDTIYFRSAVRGVLLSLTDPANWEQMGSASPDQYAALAQTMYDSLDECP